MDNDVMNMSTEIEEVDIPQRHYRTFLWVAGAVLLIVVLAAAAFVAGHMLTDSSNDQARGDTGSSFVVSGGPGGTQHQVDLNIQPALELPQTEPEVSGIYQSRTDNTLMVGTGGIEFTVAMDESGVQQSSAKFDGPLLEVVVTGDTFIYEDSTEFPGPDTVNDLDEQLDIQQIVEPVDSLDELDENTTITVWGERSGDRVIASTLVYRKLSG